MTFLGRAARARWQQQYHQCLLDWSKTLTMPVSPVSNDTHTVQGLCYVTLFVCTSAATATQSAEFVTAAATTAWGAAAVSANRASTVASYTGSAENYFGFIWRWHVAQLLNGRAGRLLDAPTQLLSSPNHSSRGRRRCSSGFLLVFAHCPPNALPCPSEPQYDIVEHRMACPSKHYNI